MTDNFSNKSEERIFRAANAPELNSAYNRAPEIENQIAECFRFSADELASRLKIEDYTSEDFLRPETLVCLLSLARAENLAQFENLISQRLFLLCRRRVRRMLREKFNDADFIEEAAHDIYADMINQCLERTEKSYDFWEVRFYQALTALVQNYLRKHAVKRQATLLFTDLSGDEEREFGEKLEDARDFAKDFETKETSKKVLRRMPEDLRKIFILYFREKETQKAIAERLGVSDRTIRNKLEKIEEFLNEWRDSSREEQK